MLMDMNIGKRVKELEKENRDIRNQIWEEEFKEVECIKTENFYEQTMQGLFSGRDDEIVSKNEKMINYYKEKKAELPFEKISHTVLKSENLELFRKISLFYKIYHAYIPISSIAWIKAVFPERDHTVVILEDPYGEIKCRTSSTYDISEAMGKILRVSIYIHDTGEKDIVGYQFMDYQIL